MTFKTFATEMVKKMIENNENFDCRLCPLREQCGKDEEHRFQTGLPSESCTEYLKRIFYYTIDK